MSLVKAKELRNLSPVELSEKKRTLERELHECLQKKINGQLEKPHQFKLIRRQIARINTIETESKNAR
ncbi:MAG: 50S ribosomal protein L29 [Candidatus Omnitrophica bacterium]|nr:50S ribosomal protein L29 [Candidatus Omnitrophota bacterium]